MNKSSVVKIICERKEGYWVATCLNFNLVAEGATAEKAYVELIAVIKSYLKAVFDTEDKLSVLALINRPAPLSKHLKFWFFSQLHNLSSFKTYCLSSLNNSTHVHA